MDKRTSATKKSHGSIAKNRRSLKVPESSRQKLDIAVSEHQRGNLAVASDLYNQILSDYPENFDALNLLGVLLYQSGLNVEASEKLQQALRINPDSESALTHYGVVLFELQKHEEAKTCFDKALAINPKYYLAYNNRGNALRALKRPDEALTDFAQAIKINPDYIDAYNNRGLALRELNRLKEALAAFDEVVAIDPAHVAAHTNRGITLRDLLCLDEAINAFDTATNLNPASMGARWNKCLVQLLAGEFRNGWQSYEMRWERSDFTSPRRDFDRPLWLGDAPLVGKSILLHSEQGYGDTIQFSRYAELVAARGATVLLEVEQALAPLAAGLDGVSKVLIKGDALPAFDYHCPLMSLPLAFRTELDSIPTRVPYLRADSGAVTRWASKLGQKNKPRLGINWAGNPNHENDRNRSIPLHEFLDLVTDDAELINLQRELSEADEQALARQRVRSFHRDLTDFSETAALVENLDLIITVDTSLAHLAGALGKPVWILLPFAPDFRWLLDREDNPWYPSARLFRQQAPGDWSDVLNRVRHELTCLTTCQSKDSTGFTMQTDIARWSDPNSLQESWDGRAETVAQFIADGQTVLDIGCGKMALERFIPSNCQYIPADLVKRDDRTVLCNLNNREFPFEAASRADIISLLGVIEYVVDLPRFFGNLRQTGKSVVVTYHPSNITGHLDRAALGWLNHLSTAELAELFISSGFQVTNIEKLSDIQMLFKLSPIKRSSLRAKRVAVLSYANVGNFGDRLGYHLLQSVLPPNAEVHHYFFKPWAMPDLSDFDLLVVGIGNSLFHPILSDELIAALNQVPRAIGIFGTQYRGEIDRNRLRDVIDRLDIWYARHEEDLYLYGRGIQNAVHLGDWLVDAFPMARPNLDKILNIGNEIWEELPLDRTIQHIQQYKTVVSTRLHPLLCALTSAEIVQYSEQRESGSQQASGKFRSMLIDIFGRTYPENQPWQVDRQKVMQYKATVSANMQSMRADIQRLLAN